MDLKGGMALGWGVPLEEWAVSEEGKVCGAGKLELVFKESVCLVCQKQGRRNICYPWGRK